MCVYIYIYIYIYAAVSRARARALVFFMCFCSAQEGFWVIMKEVFDKHYKEKFAAKGLLKKTGGWASSAL
jgi:hypothetical protein